MSVNLEIMKVNVTTVVSIVIASFSLYFFMSDLIDDALIEAKAYSIDLDMERDIDVIKMYQFQMINNIAKPDAAGRVAALEAKVKARIEEKRLLMQ